MKKVFTVILLLATAVSLFAQEEAPKKKEGKTGWNFGPLPAIGYSSDLGWHYGALSDIYYYGDGSTYPEYRFKFNVEAFWYSKGNSVYHLFFDSKYLIPGIRFSAAVSYFGNKTYSFYGFNGASPYIPDADRIATLENDFLGNKHMGFYLMQRDILRVTTCFQGRFGDTNLGWAAGLTYNYFNTGNAQSKFKQGKKNVKETLNGLSLYDLYVRTGLIPEDEAKGGHHIELKAGFVYDTRDFENNPTRGTNLEVYAFGSYDFIQKRNHYVKVAVHLKQFFPIVEDKLVFGGHMAFQGLLAGKAPFYSLQSVQSINMKQINTEGLGSTCTLRGTTSNRLMGDSYAWGNFELRWTFIRFDWIKQHWALVLNPFFDMGAVVRPYNADAFEALKKNMSDTNFRNTELYGLLSSELPTEDSSGKALFKEGMTVYDAIQAANVRKLHMSAGVGLHVIMNQNFNISFEFGKAFDPNDGLWGMNVGLNFIF